jgi:hypothetical protein
VEGLGEALAVHAVSEPPRVLAARVDPTVAIGASLSHSLSQSAATDVALPLIAHGPSFFDIFAINSLTCF